MNVGVRCVKIQNGNIIIKYKLVETLEIILFSVCSIFIDVKVRQRP